MFEAAHRQFPRRKLGSWNLYYWKDKGRNEEVGELTALQK